MPTFGRYEATRELEMTALGSVWSATLAGSSRPFIVKSYRPDPIVMRPEEVDSALASFLDRAELQRKTLAAGGQRWAPIHEVGKFPEGAYYVTNPYAVTAEKLIGRNTKLDAFSMFAIVGGVVRGLMELKKACGRPHGNLKASNVLLERSKPNAPPHVFLTDMAPADRVSEEGCEANDIDALGQLIFQLVMHRAWLGMDSWPIPPTPEWSMLGAKADKWRELCNLLLHPSPAQGLRQVDALPKLIAALKPKRRGSWLRKLALFILLVGGGGAGGFYYLQSRPELARSLLTRLRVALHLQPRSTEPPSTNATTNPSGNGTQPTTRVADADPHIPINADPPATKPATRPIEVVAASQPSTRAVTDPTTRVVIATTHPATTLPASRPIEIVSTTKPVETTRPATQVAATQPTTRPATQIAATQATTRVATTQPTTQIAATQVATTRLATTQPTTKPATQLAVTQPATRTTGPATSIAATGPSSRPTTVATTRPATREVKPAFDPATVAALGRWTGTIIRRGFGSTFDAAGKAMGGLEQPNTQLEKQRVAETKQLFRKTTKEIARGVFETIDAARKAETARKAEEVKKAEEARKAEMARKAEEARQAEEARIETARKAEMARRMEEARKAEEARIAEIERMAKEAKVKALREALALLDTDIVVSPALKGSLATAAKAKRGQMLDKAAAAVENGTLDKIDAAYRATLRHDYERWLRGELHKRAAELLAGAKESANGLEDSPAKVMALAEIAVEQVAAGSASDARASMLSARKVAGSLSKAARGSVYRDLARPLAAEGEVPAAKAMAGQILRAAWKAEALRDIAAVQAKAGKFDDALATAASITEAREQAEAYGLIAASQAAAGDSEGAKTTVAKILKPIDQIGAYLNVADAEASVKRIPMARSSVNEARKLVTQIDDADFKMRALRWVVGAEARLGNATRAKSEAKILTDPHEKALAYQSVAAAQVATGQLAPALQTLGDAEVAASAIRDSHERDEVLREIAITQADAGNPSVARRTAGGIRDATAQAVVNRAIALAQARAGDLAAASKTLGFMSDSSDKALAYGAVAEEQAKTGDEDKIAAFLATVTNPYQKSFAQIGSAKAWLKLADELVPAKE